MSEAAPAAKVPILARKVAGAKRPTSTSYRRKWGTKQEGLQELVSEIAMNARTTYAMLTTIFAAVAAALGLSTPHATAPLWALLAVTSGVSMGVLMAGSARASRRSGQKS